jgi:hypothetical protein
MTGDMNNGSEPESGNLLQRVLCEYGRSGGSGTGKTVSHQQFEFI